MAGHTIQLEEATEIKKYCSHKGVNLVRSNVSAASLLLLHGYVSIVSIMVILMMDICQIGHTELFGAPHNWQTVMEKLRCIIPVNTH